MNEETNIRSESKRGVYVPITPLDTLNRIWTYYENGSWSHRDYMCAINQVWKQNALQLVQQMWI